METGQKLALLRDLGVRRVLRVGGSYAVIVPREWVELFALEDAGDFWVFAELDDTRLCFSPITKEQVETLFGARRP